MVFSTIYMILPSIDATGIKLHKYPYQCGLFQPRVWPAAKCQNHGDS